MKFINKLIVALAIASVIIPTFQVKLNKFDDSDEGVLDSENSHSERKNRLFGKALQTAGNALGAASAIKANVDNGSKGGTINAAQSVGNLIGNALPLSDSQKNTLNKVATGTGAVVGEILYGDKKPQPAPVVKPTIPTPPTPPPAPVVKPTIPTPPTPPPAPVVKPTIPTPPTPQPAPVVNMTSAIPPTPPTPPKNNFSSSSSSSFSYSSSSSFTSSVKTSFSTTTKITSNFTPCSSFNEQDTLDFSKRIAKEIFGKNQYIDECFSQISSELDKNKGLLKEFWDKTSKITLNAISNWKFDIFSSTINEILGKYKTSDGGICAERFAVSMGGDALKNFPTLFKNMYETCTKEIKIVPKKDYLRGEEMRRENLPGDFHAKLNEESRRDNQ